MQKRLDVLGKRLAAAAIAVCFVVFFAGIARGEEVTLMFLTAVSLAVAAIPEALPAVVTIALALGASRMVQQHALNPETAGGRDSWLGHRHLYRQDRNPDSRKDGS